MQLLTSAGNEILEDVAHADHRQYKVRTLTSSSSSFTYLLSHLSLSLPLCVCVTLHDCAWLCTAVCVTVHNRVWPVHNVCDRVQLCCHCARLWVSLRTTVGDCASLVKTQFMYTQSRIVHELLQIRAQQKLLIDVVRIVVSPSVRNQHRFPDLSVWYMCTAVCVTLHDRVWPVTREWNEPGMANNNINKIVVK